MDDVDRQTSVSSVGPSWYSTTYGYDVAGGLTSLANRFSETTAFTYDNANRLTRKTLHSGQYEDLSYDSRNRLTGVTLKNSGGTSLSTQSYTYDAASRATNHTQDSVSTTYGYDDLGQLTSESRTGYSASYTYDGNGNRATKTLGGVTDTYSYDDGDKLTSVTWSGGSKTYGYDAAGRTTSVVTGAGTTTLTYDYESRVTGITYPNSSTNSFTYNGLDTRVGKVDSAGTSTYKRDGAYVTDPVLADGSAAFTPTISERRSSTTTYFHSGLKNNDRQSNTSQAVTATKQYDAFGMLISSTGTWKGPFSYAGPFGYQEDGDSGLKLLGHRYYDPSTGRFLTRDKIKDGRNWYVYASSCPSIVTDASGLWGLSVRYGLQFTGPFIEFSFQGKIIIDDDGSVYVGSEQSGGHSVVGSAGRVGGSIAIFTGNTDEGVYATSDSFAQGAAEGVSARLQKSLRVAPFPVEDNGWELSVGGGVGGGAGSVVTIHEIRKLFNVSDVADAIKETWLDEVHEPVSRYLPPSPYELFRGLGR